MKVRIGIGAGGLAPGDVGALVDGIDEHRFDSLWLSEVLTGAVPDPIVGLTWAAARSHRAKLGTTMLLPGRNPLRLAKQLAELDALSGGRLLVTLVPGLGHPPERGAIGVPVRERGPLFDDVVPLLRRLWAGETVTATVGDVQLDGVRLAQVPAQQPLEVWFGGMAPAALERCGRLSDGWLPSLCTPEEAADGRTVIEKAAAGVGRAISPEHFGVSIGYTHQPLDERTRAAIAARSRGKDPEGRVPVGLAELRRLVERFLQVGFSKFVVRPLAPPASWDDELGALAGAVADLQT